MAYEYFNQEDEDEDKDKPLGGESSVLAPGAGGAQQQGAGPQPQNKKFTELSKYLEANKAGGEQLGTEYTGRIGQQVSQARGAFEEAGQRTRGQIEEGGVDYDEGLIREVTAPPPEPEPRVRSQVLPFPGQSQQVTRGAQDLSPEKKTSFQRMLNARYTGPTGLSASDRGNLNRRVSDASTLAIGAGSEGGRRTGLESLYGRSDYGPGQRALDEALLGRSTSFRGALPQLVEQGQSLQTGYQDLLNQLSGGAEARRSETVRARQASEGALSRAKSDMMARLRGNIPESQAQFERDKRAAVQAERDRLLRTGGGGYSQSFLDANVLPATAFYNPGIEEASSPEEIAHMIALQELGGDTGTFDLSKAGRGYRGPYFQYTPQLDEQAALIAAGGRPINPVTYIQDEPQLPEFTGVGDPSGQVPIYQPPPPPPSPIPVPFLPGTSGGNISRRERRR